MPVHDWRRVRPGKFHHFHNSWIYKISDRLNGGILPRGFYAAGEQVLGDIEPDVLAFEHRPATADPSGLSGGALALADHPPAVSIVMEAEEAIYLRKQDRVAIRSSDDDRLVSLIEIVSQSNKSSRHEIDRFLRKAASALDSGIHLLIVYLQAPGPFDPQGIHGAIWEYLFNDLPGAPPGRPLTLAAYQAAPGPKAYVTPLVVGDRLPPMPLFLSGDRYVNVPLEETYGAAWEGLPEPWRHQIEAGQPR